MLNDDASISYYREESLPAEFIWPSEYILHARAVDRGSLLFTGSPDRLRLGLGRGTTPDSFDEAKLLEDRVHVDRRPYGGSGGMMGEGDLFYNYQINRLDLREADMPAAQVAHFFSEIILQSLLQEDIPVQLKKIEEKQELRQICVHRSGGMEIVARGRKCVASVFKDDGLVISIVGVYMLTGSWARVYDYLKEPHIKHVESPGLGLAPSTVSNRLMRLTREWFSESQYLAFDENDYERMVHLIDWYKVI